MLAKKILEDRKYVDKWFSDLTDMRKLNQEHEKKAEKHADFYSGTPPKTQKLVGVKKLWRKK